MADLGRPLKCLVTACFFRPKGDFLGPPPLRARMGSLGDDPTLEAAAAAYL